MISNLKNVGNARLSDYSKFLRWCSILLFEKREMVPVVYVLFVVTLGLLGNSSWYFRSGTLLKVKSKQSLLISVGLMKLIPSLKQRKVTFQLIILAWYGWPLIERYITSFWCTWNFITENEGVNLFCLVTLVSHIGACRKKESLSLHC